MADGLVRHCGYVAIIGRPNVGKSTLLNRLIGQKVSITSRKPQTTRHRILGIKTVGEAQAIYVDTPGFHHGEKRAINRYLNRIAREVLQDVDVIVFVVEGMRWLDDDERVLDLLKGLTVPVVLAINKVDQVKNKQDLLPHITYLTQKGRFDEVIPLSAKSGENIAALEHRVVALLPAGEHFYPAEQVTDRSERFLAAEIIREKLVRSLGQELPYASAVEIEKFRRQEGVFHISAVIWVERAGQKAIVIGKGGERLKGIGQQARVDLETLVDGKVFLQLWVRVKEGWSSDERALKRLVYKDDF